MNIKMRKYFHAVFPIWFSIFTMGCQNKPFSQNSNVTTKTILQINDIIPKSIHATSDSPMDDTEATVLIPEVNDSILFCTATAFPYLFSCDDSFSHEKMFYPNGKSKTEGKYANGKKAGLWISYYENGNTMSKGKFEKGFPIGNWIFYFSNGNKKAEGEFIHGRFELGCAGSNNFQNVTIKNGKWTFWFENGKIKITCSYRPDGYELERLSGLYTEWFANGKKKIEGMYRNDYKNKKWTYYYSSGAEQREEKYEYEECEDEYDNINYERPTGDWKWWNQKGVLEKWATYINCGENIEHKLPSKK